MEALHMPVPAELIAPLWIGVQILLILLTGYFLQRGIARFLNRLGQRYPLPPQLLMPLRGGLRWFIMGSAVIIVLERLGVSATVLWTALGVCRGGGHRLFRDLERAFQPAVRGTDLYRRPVSDRRRG